MRLLLPTSSVQVFSKVATSGPKEEIAFWETVLSAADLLSLGLELSQSLTDRFLRIRESLRRRKLVLSICLGLG